MKKKVLSLMLAVLMVCLAVPSAVLPASAEETASAAAITPTANWLTANLGEDGKTLSVNNASDLLAFANALAAQPEAGKETDLANDQFHGKTIVLNADIDLNPEWTASAEKPLNAWPDVSNHVFTGVFDGNGHTVSGIYLKNSRADNNLCGIFGCARSYDGEELVAVKNLAIVNSMVESGITTGSIFGAIPADSNVLLENLYVDVDINAIVVGSKPASNAQVDVGGMIGQIAGNTTCTVKNCVYAGTVDATFLKVRNIGGFVGRATGTPTISFESCAFYGTLKLLGSIGSGMMARTESADVIYKVKNCIVAGSVEQAAQKTYSGSFIAQLYKALNTKITIENSLYTELTANSVTDQPLGTYSTVPADNVDATSTYYFTESASLVGLDAQALLDEHNLNEWVATFDKPIPKALEGIMPGTEIPEPADVRFVGYQMSAITNGATNIRLVGVVDEDDLQYDQVGFKVVAYYIDRGNAQTPSKNYTTKTVYAALNGTENATVITYNPQDFDGDYFFALNCNNVKTTLGSINFKVSTFHVTGGETVYDADYSFTVSFDNAQA